MYGKNIGTLSIYQRVSSLNARVWTKSGEQGNVWKSAEVDLTSIGKYTVSNESQIEQTISEIYWVFYAKIQRFQNSYLKEDLN